MTDLVLFGDAPNRTCARVGCRTSLENHRDDAVWCSQACRQAQRRADHRVPTTDTGSDARSPYEGRTTDPRLGQLKPSARRVLALLQTVRGRGATTAQLCQPDVGGARFGARILELRRAGFAIANVRERPGSDRYRLVDAPPVALTAEQPRREPDGSLFTPARETQVAA